MQNKPIYKNHMTNNEFLKNLTSEFTGKLCVGEEFNTSDITTLARKVRRGINSRIVGLVLHEDGNMERLGKGRWKKIRHVKDDRGEKNVIECMKEESRM